MTRELLECFLDEPQVGEGRSLLLGALLIECLAEVAVNSSVYYILGLLVIHAVKLGIPIVKHLYYSLGYMVLVIFISKATL